MRITKDPKVRKQEIIESAKLLFSQKGISKTSMSDIAKQNGTAKGLVYYYFPSKEKLVLAVIEDFIRGAEQELDQIIQGERSFYKKLNSILDFYFHTIAQHPTLQQLTPANSELFFLIKERLSGMAYPHALNLMQDAMKKGIIQLKYPEYMAKIIIRGLGDLYIDGVMDFAIHIDLVEQLLGLPNGILRQEEA